jgi:hypothetical protein
MISAQTPLAFVARENRYPLFRIMLWQIYSRSRIIHSRLCFFADLFSAMRALRRRRPGDVLDEGRGALPAGLSPLIFFHPVCEAATLEQGVSEHGHQCAAGQSRIIVTRDLNLFVNIPWYRYFSPMIT